MWEKFCSQFLRWIRQVDPKYLLAEPLIGRTSDLMLRGAARLGRRAWSKLCCPHTTGLGLSSTGLGLSSTELGLSSKRYTYYSETTI